MKKKHTNRSSRRNKIGHLLDCKYHSTHYKRIARDSSKQIELENPDLKQKIKFTGRLERKDGATTFYIIGKSKETTFDFPQNSVTVI